MCFARIEAVVDMGMGNSLRNHLEHSTIAVGCRELEVLDVVQGARVPSWVLYPARAAERIERFGPYEMPLALGAPIEGRALPLVAISHGNGGSPWTHRGTAIHLARAGFAVALLEHSGNSRSDNSLAFTAANLENRPRHLRLLIDAVFEDQEVGPRLATSGAGLIGHSIGACTALALAGGRPSSFANEEADGVARPVPVARGERVRALVLLAPASVWYMADGALASVAVPILMRTAERDAHAPPLHAEIIVRGISDPRQVDHQIVPNAGHFSFQSPFPPAMTRPDFPPSQDPAGFDRAAYQAVLNAEMLAFLQGALVPDD
jgi:predicted dienelactone hydrolase